MRSKRFLSAAAVFFAMCFSPAARGSFSPSDFSGVPWKRVAPGVGYFYSPQWKAHLVRIDLAQPTLRISSYPSGADADDVTDAGFLGGKRISEFARSSKSLVSINTSPFWEKGAGEGEPGEKSLKIIGVHIADGMQFSKAAEKYPALAFFKSARGFEARILPAQTAERLQGASFAFGGFFQILSGGEKAAFPRESFDARTAVGISPGGTELFILACRKSPGLSFQDCQEIFLRLGACDAIEFDGGSSTSFCLSSGAKKAKFQSSLRANASYLGFLFDD